MHVQLWKTLVVLPVKFLPGHHFPWIQPGNEEITQLQRNLKSDQLCLHSLLNLFQSFHAKLLLIAGWWLPPISCLWWHPDAALHRGSTSASITLNTLQVPVIGLWFITVYFSPSCSAAPQFISGNLDLNSDKRFCCPDCSSHLNVPFLTATKGNRGSRFLPGVLHWPAALWNSLLNGAAAFLLSSRCGSY